MTARMLSKLVMAAVLVATPVAGIDLSPNEAQTLDKRFADTQKETRTLQAGFQQIIFFPGMRTPAVSSGVIFYRAPDDLRINYSQPAGDYFLLRGDVFDVSRRGKEPVKRTTKDKAARALLALRDILRGSPATVDTHMNYLVSQLEDEYVVRISPNAPSPDLPEMIENRVDANTLLLRSMSIRLPHGATMQFLFSHPLRNTKLAENLFCTP